jgi:hypothetical protein
VRVWRAARIWAVWCTAAWFRTCRHARKGPNQHGSIATLDLHQLRLAERDAVAEQPRGGFTQCHPPGRATDSIR